MELTRVATCVVTVVVLAVLSSCGGMGSAPYKNSKLAVEQRVEDLLGRMTLEEKVDMLSGGTWMDTRAIPRLGIPALKMNDGPLGVRYWSPDISGTKGSFGTTAFPSGISMAATWDPDLVQREGKAIGQQVKAFGRNMLLGPTVNIARLPQWGRNFEGYGEDPYLASRMAVAYVKGVQGEGVIGTVKHFAANNQEYERTRVDVKVSERALHEIYFPAFKAAIQEAGAGAVMSAYNKVNGVWCAENPHLLTEVLKKQWGFKGLVVSDWCSTHSTVEMEKAGLDVEMPSAESLKDFLKDSTYSRFGFMGGFAAPDKLLPEVRGGKVEQSLIDDKVRRILGVMFTSGLFDRQETAPTNVVDTPEQQAVARQAAIESMVLLKNAGNLLPLVSGKVRSIAVIGPNAAVARTGGGGSSRVTPKSTPLSPLDGIKERAGNQFQIGYALGCSMEGEDKAKETPAARAGLIQEAVTLAEKSDVALIFAGYSPDTEQEMYDRKLELPAGQDDLILAVAKANKNTVVVLHSGGPVLVGRWLGQVPALLEAWYPGQQIGQAVAAILFGDANPSGKLPVTFLQRWTDSSAYGNYPGKNLTVEYAEGIYVGYRHFDKKNIAPAFPFGHGLSYSTFVYSGLQVNPRKVGPGQPVEVSMSVRNTGSREGAEVVQLYVRDVQSSVDRPVRELKAFRRVVLKPGEAQTVTLPLGPGAMAFYDEGKKDWVAEPGAFEVQAGSSSRDIRLRGVFELTK
jgi:beta-glucosidase